MLTRTIFPFRLFCFSVFATCIWLKQKNPKKEGFFLLFRFTPVCLVLKTWRKTRLKQQLRRIPLPIVLQILLEQVCLHVSTSMKAQVIPQMVILFSLLFLMLGEKGCARLFFLRLSCSVSKEVVCFPQQKKKVVVFSTLKPK